jgi:hypothetical protein
MSEQALALARQIASRFEWLLVTIGTVFLLTAFYIFSISGSNVSMVSRIEVARPPLVIGAFMILAGVSLYAYGERSKLPWKARVKIDRLADGFRTRVRSTEIYLRFGRIETISMPSDWAVVLPANEYFDDQCINDEHSALGAYVKNQFGGQMSEFQRLIRDGLSSVKSESVLKEPDVIEQSYGVGHCVHLKPLGSKHALIVASVTTKRAGEGLHATFSGIFKAIECAETVLRDRRIHGVFMPVLGSGHGGLAPNEALFAVLLGIVSAARSSGGHHIKHACVVIFQNSAKAEPVVAERDAKQILRAAASLGGGVS